MAETEKIVQIEVGDDGYIYALTQFGNIYMQSPYSQKWNKISLPNFNNQS